MFLRVYRARKTYEPGAKFSTWLFTIANHAASNSLRNQSRRHEVTLRTQDSGPLGARPFDKTLQTSSGQIPARQLDKAEMRDIVRMSVETLGERQRMAVLLSKFEGMSYAEIAEVMEISHPGAEVAALAGPREPPRGVAALRRSRRQSHVGGP